MTETSPHNLMLHSARSLQEIFLQWNIAAPVSVRIEFATDYDFHRFKQTFMADPIFSQLASMKAMDNLREENKMPYYGINYELVPPKQAAPDSLITNLIAGFLALRKAFSVGYSQPYAIDIVFDDETATKRFIDIMRTDPAAPELFSDDPKVFEKNARSLLTYRCLTLFGLQIRFVNRVGSQN